MMKTFRLMFAVAVLVAWWPIPMAANQTGIERTEVLTAPSAIVLPLAAFPVIIALRSF